MDLVRALREAASSASSYFAWLEQASVLLQASDTEDPAVRVILGWLYYTTALPRSAIPSGVEESLEWRLALCAARLDRICHVKAVKEISAPDAYKFVVETFDAHTTRGVLPYLILVGALTRSGGGCEASSVIAAQFIEVLNGKHGDNLKGEARFGIAYMLTAVADHLRIQKKSVEASTLTYKEAVKAMPLFGGEAFLEDRCLPFLAFTCSGRGVHAYVNARRERWTQEDVALLRDAVNHGGTPGCAVYAQSVIDKVVGMPEACIKTKIDILESGVRMGHEKSVVALRALYEGMGPAYAPLVMALSPTPVKDVKGVTSCEFCEGVFVDYEPTKVRLACGATTHMFCADKWVGLGCRTCPSPWCGREDGRHTLMDYRQVPNPTMRDVKTPDKAGTVLIARMGSVDLTSMVWPGVQDVL